MHGIIKNVAHLLEQLEDSQGYRGHGPLSGRCHKPKIGERCHRSLLHRHTLSQNRNIRFTHSVYEPLESLLSDLSGILLVDRHWLEQSEIM